MTGWAARLEGLLPTLFLVYALPLAIALAWLTPPFQNPDEEGHFLRAVQIAGGELVGRKLGPNSSGGRVDWAVLSAAEPLRDIAGHPERPLDPAALARAEAVRWGGPVRDATFSNTVLWSPVLYLPAAATVRIGQALDLSIVATHRLCRLVNAGIAILLGWAALRLWPPGRALVFAGLCLPMAVSMYASVSHDGQMIAGAALALALSLRGGTGALAAATLLLALLGAGRPIHAPLALLLLVRQPTDPRRLLGVALALGAVAAWAPFAAAARVEFPRDGLTIDSAAQLAYLLAHPLQVPVIALATLKAHLAGYAVMFIGDLGSLDTMLPKPYLILGLATVLVALAADLLAAPVASALGRWLAMAVLLVAIGGLFLSQYLIWTAVGATVIEGVQGRYFLPFVPVAALALTGLARGAPGPRGLALAWCALFPLVTWIVTPLAVLGRYGQL